MRLVLISAFVLSSSSACVSLPVASWQNDSAYPDKLFDQGWALTEILSGQEIDLSEVHIHVYESESAFADACPDVDGLGCTDGHTRLSILGNVGTNFVEVGTSVAHMLGHIHYYAVENSLDGSHSHAEWFGETGVEAQVYLYLLNEETKNATPD